MNKLYPIAELIKNLLEYKFKKEAVFYLEEKRDWLLNVPDRKLYSTIWNDIDSTYFRLIDGKYSLDEKLSEVGTEEKKSLAKMDIWFEHPYSFMVEFDESQHFNQYRLITLANNYSNYGCSFDLNHYINECKTKVIKPGTSGFTKLKKNDAMFPPLLETEKQDNRIRQRAFRDFLKDIVPCNLGMNSTVRISYRVTNKRIKDFKNEDLEQVKKYLSSINFLNKIKIDK